MKGAVSPGHSCDQVISPIFQGVKRLIFDPPPGPARPHDLISVLFGNLQVGPPGKAQLLAFVVNLLIFEHVDPHILVGFVQGQIIDITEGMIFLLWIPGVIHTELRSLPLLDGTIELLEQKLMITWFDFKDEPQIQGVEFPNMGRIATQSVFSDDDWQVWVFTTELPPETLGCYPLTILFIGAVLIPDHLGTEGNDFPFVRMDDSSGIHLLIVTIFAVIQFLLETGIIAYFCRNSRILCRHR